MKAQSFVSSQNGVWWCTAAPYFTSGSVQSGTPPSVSPDCGDERGKYYLDLKIYSLWFNMYQLVPQLSSSENNCSTVDMKTHTPIHMHMLKRQTSNPCISWSWRPSACAGFPQAPRNLVPDLLVLLIDVTTCSHRGPGVVSLLPLHPPRSHSQHVEEVHCSFMDHCSVNLGQEKKEEAHGSGMLCAITTNDMPPCKLWP